MIEILLDSFLDTLKTIPYLLGAYCVIEWIAHRAGEKFRNGLRRFGRFGAIAGAILGLFPQCGFSVAAANFYADRMITPGTLIAVFIATSDEAIPILLSDSQHVEKVLPLLCVKLILAVVVGLFVDIFLRKIWMPRWERNTELCHGHSHHRHHRPHQEEGENREEHDDLEKHGEVEECTHSHCEGSIWLLSIVHTLKVALLIFVITAVLNIGLELIGEEKQAAFLMKGSFWQPFVAALFGLIPSCASSVFLTQLYLDGHMTVGSVIAGLSTGAGTGVLVLFQACQRKREVAIVLGFLFVVGSVAGLLLDAWIL